MTRRVARGIAAFGAGLNAEALAARAVTQEGFTILASRLRTPHGEIDLICVNAETLCLIEVKQRATLADAACALTARQAQRLYAAGDYLLQTHPDWLRDAVRFDLIVVDRHGDMRRIRDILRA